MSIFSENSGFGTTQSKLTQLIKEQTMQKWEEVGYLFDLDDNQKDLMATLYENQANWMVNEGRAVVLAESTTLGSEGSFETMIFPLIRRVFTRLLVNEIVTIQAINLPIGKLFYFVPQIGRSQFDANGRNQQSMVSGSDYTDSKNLYDLGYDNELFDRSKGAPTVQTAQTTTANLVNYAASGQGFTTKSGTAIASGATEILEFTFTGITSTTDLNNEEFLSTLGLNNDNLVFNVAAQKWSKSIISPDKKIYLSVSNLGTTSVNLTGVTLTGKTYASLELADEMAQVSFTITSVTVEVQERKMRVTWSPELAQDVKNFQNIDAETELTTLMSEQVAAEIDREVLRDLIKGAAWRRTWDYLGSSTKQIPAIGGPSVTLYTQKEWNQTLITEINKVSAQINKATLKGGANWIVTSNEVAAIFNDLEHFHVSNAEPEENKFNMGIERVGSLQGRYTVYQDAYMPANILLLGRKGTSVLDSGYIYAPYIPVTMSPMMYNYHTGAPGKMLMTRYAKKMVNNRFYGVIYVKNVDTFGTEAFR